MRGNRWTWKWRCNQPSSRRFMQIERKWLHELWGHSDCMRMSLCHSLFECVYTAMRYRWQNLQEPLSTGSCKFVCRVSRAQMLRRRMQILIKYSALSLWQMFLNKNNTWQISCSLLFSRSYFAVSDKNWKNEYAALKLYSRILKFILSILRNT